MSRVFLFLDVDGYCVTGVNQKIVVSPTTEGFRARELGWAYYSEGQHDAGSVYFHDDGLAPLPADDQNVEFVWRMHGLPIAPTVASYGGQAVPSTHLIETIQALHDAVAEITGAAPIIVHKGGSEGLWSRLACPHHHRGRRAKRKMIHCPQLELAVLIRWVASRAPF